MNTSYIAIIFGGLSPDNVDTIYNKRLQKYYFDHSKEVKFKPDADGIFILEYDTQGNIINAEFDKIYKTGVSIPENDFIKHQLNSVDKVDLKGLKQQHKALLNFYKDYLVLRMNTTSEPPKKEIEAVEVKQADKPIKSKKDNVWFKVGVLFANGTMDKYWNDNKTGIKDEFTNPKITKEVGVKGGLKYITGTFNGYSNDGKNGDKNIFNDSKKVNLIIDHLKEHSIEIAQSFIDKVQTETNI
ncbi:hypothetical protein ES711_00905 [Gelidibacter salicanalis]|uniref:Uncharacterized protein n=1 Tax=Gelidibacter salicanalis TaxID=291193 RepID=A0A5C7ASB6_9FLAO|nr:hypothetical protein [Gelidibacter salicanalis]TXE10499.1 hypothetical protein ES711_00905 [Gelidibacter salicanalis]